MDLDGLDRLLDLAKDRLPVILHDDFAPSELQSDSGPVMKMTHESGAYCTRCLMKIPGDKFPEAALNYVGHTCEWTCGLCGATHRAQSLWREHISRCAAHGPSPPRKNLDHFIGDKPEP